MKKYFLGLIAIIFAIAFSAFTKPNGTLELYLLASLPTTDAAVETGANWSTGNFGGYAACDVNPKDVACEIQLDDVTMASFIHTSGGDKFINDRSYSLANSHADYIEITAAVGQSPDRIIDETADLKFWHYDSGLADYVPVSKTKNQDYTFKNAQDDN